MKEYIFSRNHINHKYQLVELSRVIRANCEIFESNKETGEKELLGYSTPKALIAISIEILESAINSNEYLMSLSLPSSIIYSCKCWLKDADSVNMIERLESINKHNKYTEPQGWALSALRGLVCACVSTIEKTNGKTKHLSLNSDTEVCVHNVLYNARLISHETEFKLKQKTTIINVNVPNSEYEKQGTAIVDFFKSGKHLFFMG